MIESWKTVCGYPDYEVSDQGRVRSWRGRGSLPKLMTGNIDRNGYSRVHLRDSNGVDKSEKIHKLVCEAWLCPRPAGKIGRHLNGNKQDNRLSNLQWGTYLENSDDARQHGTLVQGVAVKNAKLTDKDIVSIRTDPRNSEQLAPVYGVSPGAILHVRQGRTWKHVK